MLWQALMLDIVSLTVSANSKGGKAGNAQLIGSAANLCCHERAEYAGLSV